MVSVLFLQSLSSAGVTLHKDILQPKTSLWHLSTNIRLYVCNTGARDRREAGKWLTNLLLHVAGSVSRVLGKAN